MLRQFSCTWETSNSNNDFVTLEANNNFQCKTKSRLDTDKKNPFISITRTLFGGNPPPVCWSLHSFCFQGHPALQTSSFERYITSPLTFNRLCFHCFHCQTGVTSKNSDGLPILWWKSRLVNTSLPCKTPYVNTIKLFLSLQDSFYYYWQFMEVNFQAE